MQVNTDPNTGRSSKSKSLLRKNYKALLEFIKDKETFEEREITSSISDEVELLMKQDIIKNLLQTQLAIDLPDNSDLYVHFNQFHDEYQKILCSKLCTRQ